MDSNILILVSFNPMIKQNQLYIPFEFENRKPYFQNQLLFVPKSFDDHLSLIPYWSFENDNLINVEYCSGNGDWIIRQAKDNPNINWIAVEIKIVRAKQIYKKLHDNSLKNLIVVLGPGEEFTKYYLKNKIINEIFINFPDPWPKRRHEKNRLITEDFIGDVFKILEKNKYINIISDDDNFINWVVSQFLKNISFGSFYDKPYYKLLENNFGSSFFENLWREKNKTIKHVRFKKR